MINLLYVFNMFECGNFCIKYVLKKDEFNKKVDYEKQFMSLDDVKKVLTNYYRNVECYRVYHLRNLMASGRFITLISIDEKRYHYVVVEKIEKGYVYYYNPMFLLLRREKIDKFTKKWSHYCCLFEKSNC